MHFLLVALLMNSTAQGIGVRLTQECPHQWMSPVKFENMEMPRDCVMLEQLLCAGCFGEVHFGGHMYDTIGLAIKSLKPVKMQVVYSS